MIGSVGEAHLLDQLECSIAIGLVHRPACQDGNEDVFEHRQFGQKIVFLEDEADRAVAEVGGLFFRQLQGSHIAEANGAGSGSVERPHDVQQGALTRAARPQDGDTLPRGCCQIDILEYRERTRSSRKLLAQMRHLKLRRHGRHPPLPGQLAVPCPPLRSMIGGSLAGEQCPQGECGHTIEGVFHIGLPIECRSKKAVSHLERTDISF